MTNIKMINYFKIKIEMLNWFLPGDIAVCALSQTLMELYVNGMVSIIWNRKNLCNTRLKTSLIAEKCYEVES